MILIRCIPVCWCWLLRDDFMDFLFLDTYATMKHNINIANRANPPAMRYVSSLFNIHDDCLEDADGWMVVVVKSKNKNYSKFNIYCR